MQSQQFAALKVLALESPFPDFPLGHTQSFLAYTRSRSMAALYPSLDSTAPEATAASVPEEIKRENAVLVLGSTGKMGRALVEQVQPCAPFHPQSIESMLPGCGHP